MLYIILFSTSILMYIPFSTQFFVDKSRLEKLLWTFNSFTIVYLVIAIPMLMAEKFSVFFDLIITTIVGISAGVIICFINRKKYKIKGKKIEKQEWIMLFVLALCIPFISIRSEAIAANNDIGMYFEHAMVLIEEKAPEVHSLKELDLISDEVDKGVINLLKQSHGLYFDEEKEDIDINYFSLSTWTTLLALFGKMFGLYNCSLAMNYVYILTVMNLFYLCKKIGANKYSGFLAIFLFGLSPVILYSAKTTLTELIFCYLFICALAALTEKKISNLLISGVMFGLLGFIHIYTCVYYPILCIILFMFSNDRKYKEYGYVNIIQILLFNISIQYCHIISPIYTEKQYQRLSLGGKFSFYQISLIIMGVSLLVSILQVLVICEKSDFIKKIINWLSYKFIYISRVCIILSVMGSLYYGYLLCFTNKLAIEEGVDAGSWNLRSRYINTGIKALSYLNLTNLLRATAIISLVILYLLPFIKKKFTKQQQYMYYIFLYGMMIYTLLWCDTPFNYYASRYFIPVIIPMVSVLIAMNVRSKKWLIYICLISLLYFRRYDFNFLQGAPYVGQFQIMKDSIEEIPKGTIIMANIENENLNSILINNLRVINENLVFNLDNKDEILQYYKKEPVYILSENQFENKDMKLVFNKTYDVQYSFGNGPNGSYATFVGTYPVSLNLYEVEFAE